MNITANILQMLFCCVLYKEDHVLEVPLHSNMHSKFGAIYRRSKLTYDFIFQTLHKSCIFVSNHLNIADGTAVILCTACGMEACWVVGGG